MKKKLVLIGLFLFISSFSFITLQAQTNGDLSLPSKIEILNRYHQYPFQFNAMESTQYVVEPTIGYIYTVGQLEDEEYVKALEVTNFSRFLVGLPADLQIDSQLNKVAQYASYVNMLNATISHHPEKPELISEEAYQLGKEGSAASNLAAGFRTIRDSILWGYLQDGDSYNISMVGHRRWMLNPKMQKIGFGYVDTLISSSYNGFTATYVFDQSREAVPEYHYIAWPASENMPVEFMKDLTPWSLHLGESYNTPNIEELRVELTNRKTNEVYIFDNTSNDDPYAALNTDFFAIDNSLYGLDKTIIFRPNPNEIHYQSGDEYEVEVRGIYIGDKESPIRYAVNFFDLNDQPSDWAYEEVLLADEMQLIPTMLMDRYTEDISRIDFTRLLIFGIEQYTGKTYNELLESEGYAAVSFTDTNDLDVRLAAGLGIVKGVGNNRFNPEGGIRRQEAATMLYRAGQYLGISRDISQDDRFTDALQISDWAEEAVDYVSEVIDTSNNKAVMEGMENGSFSPDSAYTREQAMITLKRLLNR